MEDAAHYAHTLRAMLEAGLEYGERAAITMLGWPGVGKSAMVGLGIAAILTRKSDRFNKPLGSIDSAPAAHNPDTPAVLPVESGLPARFGLWL